MRVVGWWVMGRTRGETWVEELVGWWGEWFGEIGGGSGRTSRGVSQKMGGR